MVVVGFNFTKISVEKKSPVSGKIKISNNVSLKDVQKKDLALGKSKQQGLTFIFEFISKYEPSIGEISLIGEIIYMEEAKVVDEIFNQWKKEKKVSKDIMTNLLNNVLTKCNIQALILSQYVNLPPPIPLPRVQSEEEKK